MGGCLVPNFTTRGVVAPPANNLIMSATLIRSFRHLECQNPSIISESIGIPNGSKKMGKKVRSHGGTKQRRNGGTESYSYRRGLQYYLLQKKNYDTIHYTAIQYCT